MIQTRIAFTANYSICGEMGIGRIFYKKKDRTGHCVLTLKTLG